MFKKTDTIFGFSVMELLQMPFEDLSSKILESSGIPAEAVMEEVLLRKSKSNSGPEITACNRVLSALMNGVDTLLY